MPLDITTTTLPDVLLITPQVHADDRGRLFEGYRRSAFEAAGIGVAWQQDNLSRSRAGVLRGLHYQRPPHAQAKLVRVVAGAIYDVVVDLRRGSTTCGQWLGVTLDAARPQLLFVPEGCAHGFLALADDTVVAYSLSVEYAPAHQGGVAWDDPQLAIPWPLAQVQLSERDRDWPPLDVASSPFVFR